MQRGPLSLHIHRRKSPPAVARLPPAAVGETTARCGRRSGAEAAQQELGDERGGLGRWSGQGLSRPHRHGSVDLLADQGDRAKILSGGQSLMPAMNLNDQQLDQLTAYLNTLH